MAIRRAPLLGPPQDPLDQWLVVLQDAVSGQSSILASFPVFLVVHLYIRVIDVRCLFF